MLWSKRLYNIFVVKSTTTLLLYAIISTLHKKKEVIEGFYLKNIMNFYQRLRDMREDHDKSQEDIAKILNTTQQQYSRWESGTYQMPIENYKILAQYYNVSIDYLCGLLLTLQPLHRNEGARK